MLRSLVGSEMCIRDRLTADAREKDKQEALRKRAADQATQGEAAAERIVEKQKQDEATSARARGRWKSAKTFAVVASVLLQDLDDVRLERQEKAERKRLEAEAKRQEAIEEQQKRMAQQLANLSEGREKKLAELRLKAEREKLERERYVFEKEKYAYEKTLARAARAQWRLERTNREFHRRQAEQRRRREEQMLAWRKDPGAELPFIGHSQPDNKNLDVNEPVKLQVSASKKNISMFSAWG
eukprot:TRINITY_DN3730_c0_g1_i2.p1 TRINITY_DN3730_c0_g1~~TRINITY_DN3730_c0_g1_i2.p1  ORF type:complete len:241 (+),score=89.67 TRINITY_DN3730_c0_g1_i2:107-829(+)